MTSSPEEPGARTDPAAVLDQMRHTAARLLSGLASPPQVVRLRAGEVAIDIEWAPADRAAPASGESRPEREPAQEEPVAGRRLVTAPGVGVFYRAPEPGAKPFVAEGDNVLAGQQLAIIEVMKLMVPVEAEFDGQVTEVLKGDGAPVEYGEPLFALAPADPT